MPVSSFTMQEMLMHPFTICLNSRLLRIQLPHVAASKSRQTLHNVPGMSPPLSLHLVPFRNAELLRVGGEEPGLVLVSRYGLNIMENLK